MMSGADDWFSNHRCEAELEEGVGGVPEEFGGGGVWKDIMIRWRMG